MDGSSFDRISRRLAVTTSRRGGVAALVAGALGLAGFSVAEARRGAGRRHEKLACRNDQSECTANEQCCSGICKLKPDSGTEYRCVGKRKKNGKKNEKKDDKGGGGGDTCIADGDTCPSLTGCCTDLICYPNPLQEPFCRPCGRSLDYCNEQTAPCCAGHSCIYLGGPSALCCVNAGQPCSTPQECCGYGESATCVSGTCQVT